MNNYVFVLDANKEPLKPCTPRRAKLLQRQGKAKALRRYPFTLILQYEARPAKPFLELRIDPGSRFTGFALVNPKNEVLWAMELEHRGQQISQALTKRAGFRRNRRHRQTRYRKKRFNRHQPSGWLAPSLNHRVQTVETWIKRICRYAPVGTITIEKVKFDPQKLENCDIQGVEYQQGTLFGYSVREALLEHWGRECAYCGATDVPLQVEHIQPKSKGGSNRFSNLTLACSRCNQAKGNQPVEKFLSDKPEVLKKIKAHCQKRCDPAEVSSAREAVEARAAVRRKGMSTKRRAPRQFLADAACVNATRHQIFEVAQNTGLKVQAGSGALAKLVRHKSLLPKAHWLDAACNSIDEQPVKLLTYQPLLVICKGLGNRQSRRCNAQGFPAITSIKQDTRTGKKIVNYVLPKTVYTHAKTGDLVNVTLDQDRKHIKSGTYTARVKTPTPKGVEVKINGHRISSKLFNFVHRSDGYDYSYARLLSV